MTRPDDIPEDVWAVADEVRARIFNAMHDDDGRLTDNDPSEIVARAILAERERMEAAGVVDAEWKARCEIAEADRADMAETIRRLEARTFGSQLVG